MKVAAWMTLGLFLFHTSSLRQPRILTPDTFEDPKYDAAVKMYEVSAS